MSSTSTNCDLCGLTAGLQPVLQKFDNAEKTFCCSGCLNVYIILRESGVLAQATDFRQSEIYRQSLKLGLISNARTQKRAIPDGTESRETVYKLSGLWCTSCGWLIEHALEREYGVLSAEVLFASDLLKVKYCPQYLEPDRIPNRVKALGYRAEDYQGAHEPDRRERADLLLRLGVAGGLWMNVMLFSLVVYASYFEGISEWARRIVPLILMGLATPAVFYSGWPILRLAWYGLREGTLRMEALISSGVLTAYGYSIAQLVMGGNHYYFDTSCAIVTLVLAGKAMEREAKEKTSRAISLLYGLMPRKARMVESGQERFVAVEELKPGMVLLVKPGERIPADGFIREGNSLVDESVVTGESHPRPKGPGDLVISGSLSGAGVLEVQVTRTGGESALAQIIGAVEKALASRTGLERSVDRVSRIFVPVVLAVSVLTLLGGIAAGLEFADALLRAIAVMVIACPCALGIATPLATTAAVGTASRGGILIRDARVLETIRQIDVLVLDKTGTATEGDFKLRQIHLLPQAVRADETQEFSPLQWVASLEACSEHPLAQAVVRHARSQELKLEQALHVEIYEGKGIAGQVREHRVAVGNRQLMELENITLEEQMSQKVQVWETEALTVSFVAIDGELCGALGFGDRLRAEAVELIRQMRLKGIRTALLSGDSPATTERIARQLGVDEFRGGVAPQEKAATMAEFRRAGAVVAMAGDGINDAPALAAADLGIAMGSGTDLAMQAAPVVLMNNSLAKIAEIFELTRFAFRIVRQNLFWAFFYNTLGIGLAVAGILNPILAAGAMFLSSLSVIGNSLRLSSRIR
jgi:P-type Cu2+ transporter